MPAPHELLAGKIGEPYRTVYARYSRLAGESLPRALAWVASALRKAATVAVDAGRVTKPLARQWLAKALESVL
jgi:hypothetical protein